MVNAAVFVFNKRNKQMLIEPERRPQWTRRLGRMYCGRTGGSLGGKRKTVQAEEQEAQTLEEEAGHDQGFTPFSLSMMCWLLLSAQHWAELNLRMEKKKWLLKTMFLLVKWRRQARPRLCDEWCETHNCYLVEEESSQLGACLGQRGS